jgi:photoactive yellow protein
MLRRNLYNVMTSGTKDVLVNFRLRPDVRDEFKAVAELRGSTVSNLLHQYVIKLIREEKAHDPEEFARAVELVREVPVIEQTADTKVVGIHRVRNGKAVPCIWDGKPSKGGICEDCRKELTSDPKMTRAKLNELLYGTMLLSERGTILEYNKAETEMARVTHKRAFGKNFFTDIAPCADVQDFYGRYESFLRGNKQREEFEFKYPFKGYERVLITFIRVDERRALVTAQKALEMPRHGTGQNEG